MTSRGIQANKAGVGSYVSMAAALDGADQGVRHVLKMGFTAESPNDAANPDELELRFVSDHALIDFASLKLDDFDVDKIIKDCDFVKKIVSKNPDRIKQLLRAYQSSPVGFEKANAIAKGMGLTEEEAIKAGGGVAWLAVVLIIVLAARACNDAGNGNPQRRPK